MKTNSILSFSALCPICNKSRKIKGAHINCSKIMQKRALEEKEKEKRRSKRIAQYKYSKKHPEKISEMRKRIRENLTEEQKQKIREKYNKWASSEENKKKHLIHSQNRRARKKNNGGVLTKGLQNKLYTLQKGKCACCKNDLSDGYHLDHIMPLSKGGINEDKNIQLLCPKCNMSKGSKDPIYFMQSKDFLL